MSVRTRAAKILSLLSCKKFQILTFQLFDNLINLITAALVYLLHLISVQISSLTIETQDSAAENKEKLHEKVSHVTKDRDKEIAEQRRVRSVIII